MRKSARDQARQALKGAVEQKKPSVDQMFEDVYESLPPHLQDQQDHLKNHVRKYAEYYDLPNFQDGEEWIKKA